MHHGRALPLGYAYAPLSSSAILFLCHVVVCTSLLLLPTKLFLIVARIVRGLQAHCRVCGSRGKRRLATTVQQGICTGEIRANTDPRRIANILIATLEGSLLLSRLEGTRTAFLNVRATLDLMPGALRAPP